MQVRITRQSVRISYDRFNWWMQDWFSDDVIDFTSNGLVWGKSELSLSAHRLQMRYDSWYKAAIVVFTTI